jgi:hypothetical protein
MSGPGIFLAIGVTLFLAGGALLAMGGSTLGVSVGTTLALTGVGLIVWSWWTRSPGDDGHGR